LKAERAPRDSGHGHSQALTALYHSTYILAKYFYLGLLFNSKVFGYYTCTYLHTININIYALVEGGYYLFYKYSIYTTMLTKKNRHDIRATLGDFIVGNAKFYNNNGQRD
jgi:hypothetical protein